MLTKITNSMIRNAHVDVFDFLTDSQIASVKSYSFASDVTSSCQDALNYARANNLDCYFPAGGYLVTGLVIPGDVNPPTVDDRKSAIRIFGQGFGEPFVTTNTGGTVIKCVSEAPVLRDILGTNPSSNGTVEIDHIRFDGTSNTSPVVLLQSFYGLSSMHNCAIYQRGTGDGVLITYSAGVWINMCWAMNKDWNTYNIGASRSGVGFFFANSYDSGLVTITKCSSRGWKTAYSLNGSVSGGTEYSPTIEQSECSVVYNGVYLSKTQKAVVDSMYMEGMEGGKGIDNSGSYSTITNNLIFPGCSIGIDSRFATNRGAVIRGNVIGLGAVEGSWGIALAGNYGQEVCGNSISRTAGTANQIGMFVDVNGKIDVHANAFDPKETWTGSGSSKVSYTATSLFNGIITGESNDKDFPVLCGAVAHAYAPLTEASVSSNILTVPDGGYFVMTAGSAVTIQRLDGGIVQNRQVTIRTTNANATIQNTAYIKTAGAASFSGPGVITFLLERTAGATYAYEIARTSF